MLSPDVQRSLESRAKEAEANLDGAIPYLTSRGITRETAERFRLGYDPAQQRLTIPYLTPTGLWRLKARCAIDHNCKEAGHPKYVNDPGSEQHLFNAQTLLAAERVILTEGELDAITLEQAGLSAVGYPGAETWSRCRYWRWCFDSVDEVVVVGDGDEAGRKAAQAVSDSLRDSIHGDVNTVILPAGEDANSFISRFGEYEFLSEIGWI